jgi:hypothetical protein
MSETMWPNGVPSFGKEMKNEFFLGQDGVHEEASHSDFLKFKELFTQAIVQCIILILKDDTTEQHALKNVNNCLKTSFYSYLETSGGQSSNLYLNVVQFFNRVNQDICDSLR